jgi:hypothetical protein
LAARLETRVNRNGKWCREVVYLVRSFTLEELQAEGMLSIKRGYWVVESRLHHCLDITVGRPEPSAHTRCRPPFRSDPARGGQLAGFQKRFCSARGGRGPAPRFNFCQISQHSGLIEMKGRVLNQSQRTQFVLVGVNAALYRERQSSKKFHPQNCRSGAKSNRRCKHEITQSPPRRPP